MWGRHGRWVFWVELTMSLGSRWSVHTWPLKISRFSFSSVILLHNPLALWRAKRQFKRLCCWLDLELNISKLGGSAPSLIHSDLNRKAMRQLFWGLSYPSEHDAGQDDCSLPNQDVLWLNMPPSDSSPILAVYFKLRPSHWPDLISPETCLPPPQESWETPFSHSTRLCGTGRKQSSR